MELELCPAFLRSMKLLRPADPGSVAREAVALFLFRKKLVSVGKAAGLAGMSLAGFTELLRSVRCRRQSIHPRTFQWISKLSGLCLYGHESRDFDMACGTCPEGIADKNLAAGSSRPAGSVYGTARWRHLKY